MPMAWGARCVLHSALHSSLYARPSLRASVTASFRTSLRLPDPPPAALLDGTAEHTKAQVEVPVNRPIHSAARRTAGAGEEMPATAPEHPERAL
jgi:hypothetical protein